MAKLIDVTRCIGCKACQAACMEWNDLRAEVGFFEGSYDNPSDLNPSTWTLMRFTEHENEEGNLEWLIRKDGCMHCEDPGCLKACPAPGAIVQYANGIVDFISENCIGCGYCVKRMSVQHSSDQPGRSQNPISAPCARIGSASVWNRLASRRARQAPSCSVRNQT